MAYRTLRTDPFQSTMTHAQSALAMSSNVSFIMTPMRNTDIKKAAQSGDWTDLLAKAQVQTRRFRREFYK
jgi:hypothetical protein